jgi:hypothetical protein
VPLTADFISGLLLSNTCVTVARQAISDCGGPDTL